MLSHYPENYKPHNNNNINLASLTCISGTRMDLLPWNSASNELETTIIITSSQTALFLQDLFLFGFGFDWSMGW